MSEPGPRLWTERAGGSEGKVQSSPVGTGSLAGSEVAPAGSRQVTECPRPFLALVPSVTLVPFLNLNFLMGKMGIIILLYLKGIR